MNREQEYRIRIPSGTDIFQPTTKLHQKYSLMDVEMLHQNKFKLNKSHPILQQINRKSHIRRITGEITKPNEIIKNELLAYNELKQAILEQKHTNKAQNSNLYQEGSVDHTIYKEQNSFLQIGHTPNTNIWSVQFVNQKNNPLLSFFVFRKLHPDRTAYLNSLFSLTYNSYTPVIFNKELFVALSHVETSYLGGVQVVRTVKDQ